MIPMDDFGPKWYSMQEKRGIRDELIRDIRQMTREIQDTPTDTITPEQLNMCLGIELFLSPGLARQAAELKRTHIKAVLAEQRTQRALGLCDIERLSSISKESSQHFRERAHKLAEGYSKCVV